MKYYVLVSIIMLAYKTFRKLVLMKTNINSFPSVALNKVAESHISFEHNKIPSGTVYVRNKL